MPNTRQMALAVTQYLQDYDETFPKESPDRELPHRQLKERTPG